ncbi:MAG: hypothetical protein R3A13_08470 [Bdellovibrionota bacterium]
MNALDELIKAGLVIILFSSFLKVAVTFSILSFGFGLDRFGMGAATLALALAVSFVVMGAAKPDDGVLSAVLTGKKLESTDYQEFVSTHADPELVKRFSKIRSAKTQADPDAFEVKSVAFLVTELREAFSLGFMLLIPLLVIDLLVVNLLMALGITQISTTILAVPLKILLFVSVDGWALLTERILSSYI